MNSALLDRDQGPLQSILDELHDLRATQEAILDCLAGRTKSHYVVEEVARLTGRAPFTVRRWLKEGKITAVRVTGTGPRGRLLVPQAELAKLVSSGLAAEMPQALPSKNGPRNSARDYRAT